jgi:hypothetical protein
MRYCSGGISGFWAHGRTGCMKLLPLNISGDAFPFLREKQALGFSIGPSFSQFCKISRIPTDKSKDGIHVDSGVSSSDLFI